MKNGALDATGPLLPVASVLFVLWSCVALARQADPRLGAHLLVQQVRTVVGVTAAIGVAYLALAAGFSALPAVALATAGGLGAAAASDGMLDRLGRAVLRRWGEHAPEGPMRVTVYAAGTRASVGATLRAAAEELPRVVGWSDLQPGDLAWDANSFSSLLLVRKSGRAQWRHQYDGSPASGTFGLTGQRVTDNTPDAPQAILVARDVKGNASAVRRAWAPAKDRARALAEQARQEGA